MLFRQVIARTTLIVLIGLLAACQSAEERAEKHYQAGLEYLAAGDEGRALVEFRNVFKLNGMHKEARRAYAKIERDRGNANEAFAQYLRLAEQYPDDLDAIRSLAEIAAYGGEWDTAGRYAVMAEALAPADENLKAIKVAADYGMAVNDNEVGNLIAAAKSARELQKVLPENILLHRIVIDDLVRAQDFGEALKAINAAIAVAPTDRGLYGQRLSIYAAQGNDGAVEQGLIDMVARFPDAPEMSAALVRWYMSRKELDKAEAHLRNKIVPGSNDDVPILDLVRFLAETRGAEAAVVALDEAIASGRTSPVFLSARAGFIFDLDRRDEAIATMQEILRTADASEETRRTKVGLARMLTIVGNPVGARKLIEEVLAEDRGEVEAIKLKATWLINDDETGDAIAILRSALEQNPRDPAIMTLMSEAYARDGNQDLMREMLSQAVDVSNHAPDESIRYAQLLANEGKLVPAESILIDALRIAPGNGPILILLGQIYVAMSDWPRAESVAVELEQNDNPNIRATAAGLRAASLAGQQQTDAAVGYLQGLVDRGEAGLAAQVAILRTHLANGQNRNALAYSARLVQEHPDDLDIRFVDASVRAMTGDTAGAETALRGIVDKDRTLLQPWLALIRIVGADPARSAEAMGLLDQAVSVLPEAQDLQWAKAGLLERDGDIAGAIAIYESLYKDNSANPIIANNLASLLSNHSTDPDSIARAEVIARRLRGSDVPAYQDTFGWIAYLRGNYADALAELSKAAVGLDRDPAVQYHLAMTYLALDRRAEALGQFQAALALVAEDDGRAFVADAREKAASLATEVDAPAN